MIPSLQSVLPPMDRSIHKKGAIQKPLAKPKASLPQRHHGRTTSVPSVLPSYRQKQEEKLSFDVLLDAIDLDQQMRQFFKTEVMKSKTRAVFRPAPMLRRRSKSAPSAPPSYHYQRAFNAKWITQDQTIVTTASHAQQVAQSIVSQHFDAVKKRDLV
ncbi:hypothetical protein BY458DRAFT_517615 [Sporodiniella umbellata]|nr:hypothetical protein BY458DRAFT_517615 [Sporodiniella umbellata]